MNSEERKFGKKLSVLADLENRKLFKEEQLARRAASIIKEGTEIITYLAELIDSDELFTKAEKRRIKHILRHKFIEHGFKQRQINGNSF